MFYKVVPLKFLYKIFVLLFIFIVLPGGMIFADCPPDCSKTTQKPPDSQPPVQLCNPLVGDCTKKDQTGPTPQVIIGKVLNQVLGIVGSLALLMFIYGGFTWMMAGGNQEAVTKGKNILIWATIGLIVIFSAYALVRFVFQGVGVTP